MQEVYFFFDDSGVLHKNEASGYFVYAGYVFCGKQDMENARHKYIHANKAIRNATGMEGELKAARLETKHKRALLNPLKDYESISAAVDISRLFDAIMDKPKARCRYKDYILKMCVRLKLQEMIRRRVLDEFDAITIHISIDEQLTGTDGYYDLRESIQEELEHGIANWDYGTKHESIFYAPVTVDIRYCDSSRNYMIQASDILANRVWTSYRTKNEKLREIPNHFSLTFP